MTSTYVNWGEATVKLTWQRDSQIPCRDLITSVHGFCFHEEKLLLVNLHHRGWDFPGGHIEVDETPEECLTREAREEGYVEGRCHLVGYVTVDHTENPIWNEKSRYPKVGYQVFYRMDIDHLHKFEAEYEAAERIFIHPNKVQEYYSNWHDLYQEIMNCALTIKA